MTKDFLNTSLLEHPAALLSDACCPRCLLSPLSSRKTALLVILILRSQTFPLENSSWELIQTAHRCQKGPSHYYFFFENGKNLTRQARATNYQVGLALCSFSSLREYLGYGHGKWTFQQHSPLSVPWKSSCATDGSSCCTYDYSHPLESDPIFCVLCLSDSQN